MFSFLFSCELLSSLFISVVSLNIWTCSLTFFLKKRVQSCNFFERIEIIYLSDFSCFNGQISIWFFFLICLLSFSFQIFCIFCVCLFLIMTCPQVEFLNLWKNRKTRRGALERGEIYDYIQLPFVILNISSSVSCYYFLKSWAHQFL